MEMLLMERTPLFPYSLYVTANSSGQAWMSLRV